MPKNSKENLIKGLEELQKWLARKQESYKGDDALIRTATAVNTIINKLQKDDSKVQQEGIQELKSLINSLKWTLSEDKLNKAVADVKSKSKPDATDRKMLEKGEILQDMFKIKSKDVKDNLRSELKKILDLAEPAQYEAFKRQVAQGGGLFKSKPREETVAKAKKTPPKLKE